MNFSIKRLFVIASFALVSVTTVAFAMSNEQMQQMMQQAQEAQKCFAQLDQSKFAEIEAKGRRMESEIRSLCQAGKRNEAMSSAMKFSREMHNDPHLEAVRKCGEMMQGAMAQMPQPFMPPTTDELERAGHVCDEF